MEKLAQFATCKVERKGYEAIIISQVTRPGDSERALYLLSPAVTCPLHTVTTLNSPLHTLPCCTSTGEIQKMTGNLPFRRVLLLRGCWSAGPHQAHSWPRI